MRSPSGRGAETSPESCEPCSEFSSSKCRHQSCSTNYLDNDNATTTTRLKKKTAGFSPQTLNILHTTSRVSYGTEAYQELQF